MMFMGVMTFMVLPLFFVVTAQDISNRDFGSTKSGKLVEFALYAGAALCVFTFIALMIISSNS